MQHPRTAIAETRGRFKTRIDIGPHTLVGDETEEDGGTDQGPSPHELLAASLAACTSMTIRSYADLKGLPLSRVRVEVTVGREAERTVLRKSLRLEGELNDAQRDRLVEISQRCPVSKVLSGAIVLETELV